VSDHIFISLHVPEPRVRSTGENRLGLFGFKCSECGHRFEDFVRYIETDGVVCEKCGGATVRVVSFSTNTEEQNRYPYFDRGLGVMLHSKEERRRICKERGLTPIEGDSELGDPFGVKEDARIGREEDAAYDDYMDEVEHNPEFAAYRQAKASGQFDDVYDKTKVNP